MINSKRLDIQPHLTHPHSLLFTRGKQTSLTFDLTSQRRPADRDQQEAGCGVGQVAQAAGGRAPGERADPPHAQEETPGGRRRFPGPDRHPHQG